MDDLNGCVLFELVSIQVSIMQFVFLNRIVPSVIHSLEHLLDLDLCSDDDSEDREYVKGLLEAEYAASMPRPCPTRVRGVCVCVWHD